MQFALTFRTPVWTNPRAQLKCGSPASEQSAHHAANQSAWTATAVMASTAPAVTTGRRVIIGCVAAADAGVCRRDGLGQQRLMLQRVEEARPGIAACRLPAPDDGAGLLVEPSVDPGVEADTLQLALHVATLCLVQANLIFGFLSCVV